MIPNLNKEAKRLPISSVVLSSQRVELKDAIYNAQKSKDQQAEEAANPLVQDGAKLIPSVTRVFSRDQNLFVYLQAYEQGAAANAAARGLCHVLSGDRKRPLRRGRSKINAGWDNHVKTMPLGL